jgi:fluoroquinolone transport system ATP-binding protein
MIDVRNLTFRYPGAEEDTLRGLDFRVEPGEIFGFLGPSGAGKSTAQKILFGMLKGFGGSVSLINRDLEDWGRELYRRLGVFFEFPHFYGRLTAAENLEYYRLFYSTGNVRWRELSARLGLGKDLNRRVEQFSKGMQMRLSLIRALQHNPDLLFLDEPTSGLDPIHAAVVKDIIREEAQKGRTVFLTTHNMGLAQDLCHSVSFLVDGEIRLTAAPDDLRRDNRSGEITVQIRRGTEIVDRSFPLDHLGSNGEFTAFLSEGEVLRIRSEEPDLEELFLRTTGRELSRGDQP